jgi:uncharacterized protein (TIGR03083 family)
MLDTAAVYAETRDSLRTLVAGLSDEELTTNVPATPAWSVRDVVAHLVGEARITNTGDAPAEFRLIESLQDPEQAELRDKVNAEEVARRGEVPFPEVLEEWDELVDRLMPKLRGEEPFPLPEPFLDSILVSDLAGHGQDIRGALNGPASGTPRRAASAWRPSPWRSASGSTRSICPPSACDTTGRSACAAPPSPAPRSPPTASSCSGRWPGGAAAARSRPWTGRATGSRTFP